MQKEVGRILLILTFVKWEFSPLYGFMNNKEKVFFLTAPNSDAFS